MTAQSRSSHKANMPWTSLAACGEGSMLPLQRAEGQFLVWELRSHMPRSMSPKNQITKTNKKHVKEPCLWTRPDPNSWNIIRMSFSSSGMIGESFSPAFCLLSQFPGALDGKDSACSVRDPGSIPGSGRSSREGNGNPLQYSWGFPGGSDRWEIGRPQELRSYCPKYANLKHWDKSSSLMRW